MFFSIRWCRRRLMVLTYCVLTLWASLDGPAYALVGGNVASDTAGCQQGQDDDDFVAPRELGARRKATPLPPPALDGPAHDSGPLALPSSPLDVIGPPP